MAAPAKPSPAQGTVRIGIVAGEASGDLLGAELIEAVRERLPGARFEGIGGPLMTAAGCHSLYPIERLSVMGLVEVLGHLPGLLAIRRSLRRHFLADPPDLFVGVDAPDFNLGLERALKRGGIATVHYVSPSVWAWRRYRVRKIARSTDLILTLFPFEADFYRDHRVPVRFVGHPLADLIPEHVDPADARKGLGLDAAAPTVAILPGSRRSEVKRLSAPFLATAAWCLQQRPELRFVVPAANPPARTMLEQALAAHPGDLPVTVVDGRAREAMAAADAVLLASGTATLEALLLKRPMVVAYRLAPVTYQLTRWLLKTPFYSLPNLLAGRALVPEVTQEDVDPAVLGPQVLQCLEDNPRIRALQEQFGRIHHTLRRGASRRAAEAVLEMAGA